MLRALPTAALAAASFLLAPSAEAVTNGLISTDRFGYAGTIERFDTLADAKAGTGATDAIAVEDRDLSLYFSNGQGADFNAALGSWWYTTDAQGRAGWGNTNGNTGVGYMQIFDDDGSTDTDIDMSFSNFDGSYWRDFNFSATLEDATRADDYGRLSAYDNVNDGGSFHSFQIDLTATGLQGVANGNAIESLGPHPTGVTGTMQGVFELTENQTSPDNLGFYRFFFDLTMDNWAWDNRTDLKTTDADGNVISDEFSPSRFVAVVPVPAGVLLIGSAFLVAGAVSARARRKAA